MSPIAARLVGVRNTTGVFPSFCTPVFKTSAGLCVQVSNAQQIVERFEPYLGTGRGLLQTPAVAVRAGGPTLFAFAFASHEVLTGIRSVLLSRLSQERQRIWDRPFLFLELLELD